MEHDNAPQNDRTLEEKHEHQWSIGWRLPAVLFGPLLVVFAIAIGHDQYLISLHETLIGSYNNQLIVKGANNGLATLSSLLLGVSVTAALTEMTWDLIRRSRLSVEHLDALFQLPSPFAFLATPSVVQRASYLILISLVYYSLTILSIFAPGSLSARVDVVVKVPVINLASGLYHNIQQINDSYYPYLSLGDGVYSGPTPLFTNRVNEALSTNATSSSQPPLHCGQQCKYSFRFHAPSITCYNNQYSSYLAPKPKLKFPDIFRADSNAQFSLRNSSPQQALYLRLSWFDIRNEDDFLLAQEDKLLPIEKICDVKYSEYSANVSWTPHGRKFDAQVINSFHPLYNFNLPNRDTFEEATRNYSIVCDKENYIQCNFIGFIDAFSSLFPRNISAWYNSDSFGVLDHIFSIRPLDSGMTSFYLPSINSSIYNGYDYDHPLQIALANGLEAFLNVSRASFYTTSQDTSVYEHSSNYLWTFYGTALAATTLVSCIAIMLAYRHGIPSAVGFSHFLIMTRNPNLAHIAENAPLGTYQLVAETRKTTLRFGKLGVRYENNNEMVGFAVDDDEVVPLQKPVAKELCEQ